MLWKLFFFLFFITSAHAEEYLVNPLLCTATPLRIKNPENPKSSMLATKEDPLPYNFDVGFKVISLGARSIEKCPPTEENTLTQLLIGDSLRLAKLETDSSSITGNWVGGSIKREGDQILIPYGIQGQKVTLKIKQRTIEESGRIVDRLEGIEEADANTRYQLSCNAVVVERNISGNNRNCD